MPYLVVRTCVVCGQQFEVNPTSYDVGATRLPAHDAGGQPCPGSRALNLSPFEGQREPERKSQ